MGNLVVLAAIDAIARLMGRVMMIKPEDDVLDRARDAIREADRDRQLPMRWIAGRRVYNQIRNHPDRTPYEIETLMGIGFECNLTAPPDLLELDVF